MLQYFYANNMPMNKHLLYFPVLFIFFSCKHFVFHPNEIRVQQKDLNSRNIEKIKTLPAKAVFRFILLGDTQRFYNEVDDFIEHANKADSISFVLIAGDLVDFGLNKEYNWIASKFGKLKMPYVAVIGNHDMVANGRKIYAEMFGPENFSFYYGKNKFILLNSNSREVNYNGEVPAVNWLKQQLNDEDADNLFVLSHVPPFSIDFDKTLEDDYAGLLAAQPNTRLSMHGHEHKYKYLQPYETGPPYVIAAATHIRSYVMVTVEGEEVSVTEKFY
jgi:3',5'-cyclic-AMP phosphodiesterase